MRDGAAEPRQRAQYCIGRSPQPLWEEWGAAQVVATVPTPPGPHLTRHHGHDSMNAARGGIHTRYLTIASSYASSCHRPALRQKWGGGGGRT